MYRENIFMELQKEWSTPNHKQFIVKVNGTYEIEKYIKYILY